MILDKMRPCFLKIKVRVSRNKTSHNKCFIYTLFMESLLCLIICFPAIFLPIVSNFPQPSTEKIISHLKRFFFSPIMSCHF